MVDCKPLKISIGTIIKDPEMLKFGFDHFKTEKIRRTCSYKVTVRSKVCS